MGAAHLVLARPRRRGGRGNRDRLLLRAAGEALALLAPCGPAAGDSRLPPRVWLGGLGIGGESLVDAQRRPSVGSVVSVLANDGTHVHGGRGDFGARRATTGMASGADDPD